MLARRNVIRPTLVLLAMGGVALAILLLPTRSVSIDWGAGGGEWVSSSYANQYSALCAQNDPNDRCKEWCEVGSTGQLEGTGQLCCVSPGSVCYAHNTFYP